MSLRVANLEDGRRAIIIRTSDRANFRQCRRKWGWSSHLKRNLGSRYLASPLWFGSAIHFALEDFHGYNYFGRASRAFMAYCIATAKQNSRDLPNDAQELYQMGIKMMDYYQDCWLRFRRPTETFWLPDENGKAIPQCEVNFEIPIPLDEHPKLKEYAEAHGANCILYRGTIDRVGVDEDGYGLWIVEYKTAKRAEHFHYQNDSQISTYCWAASHIYDRPVYGVKYYQFIKQEPNPPRILGNGKLSTASNLASSAPLYRSALERMYGSNEGQWPKANKDKLVELMMAEDEHRDRYIVRETIRRNATMCNAEAVKILLEVEDMINPDLPLYPNPTRQCPYMCSFLAPCVSMDDGGDWESELEQEFSERDQAPDRMWRNRLPSIEALMRMIEAKQEPNLEGIQVQIKSLDQERRAKIEAGEEPMDLPTFSW